ncbi:MAG: TAT-variant-translocated molybdopterin oxidoreductase [Rubricoccaceae bacterium]
MIELDVLSAADAAARQQPGEPYAAWRSTEDRENTADYARLRADEFLPGAADGDDLAGDPGPSRRSFLKVMGASMAMAGLTGCRRPVEYILPYARKPQEVTPGIANFYATAMPLGGVVHALLVESHEGRPTKVEGNPDHPVSQGATDVFAQASLLNLYDPDRSRTARRRDGSATGWSAFVGEASRLLARAGEAPLVVLAEPSSSLSLAAARQALEAAYPGTVWIDLHPHGDDPVRLGTQAAFGRPLRPRYRFSGASVIVSFDGDFLSDDLNSVSNAREYAASRRVDERGTMSRLYVAESTMTPTGGMADHRLRMRAGDLPFFAAAVGQALGVEGAAAELTDAASQAFVNALVEDVRAAAGTAVFVAGPTQPPPVHALCAVLNARFGAAVVDYLDTGEPAVEPVGPRLRTLVADMNAGRVGTLLMLGTNPVYTLPDELGFAEALGRVPLSIHVGAHYDETAQRATWHVPRAHYLEAWGDGRAYDGTVSIIQPLIAPLYADAHSDLEVVNLLATGRNNAGYDLVREALRAVLTGDYEDAWRTALHDGYVPGTQYPVVSPGAGAAVSFAGVQRTPPEAVELVFRTSPTLYDGTFSNNAWMLEAPDPVTKVTWDGVALMSRTTAAGLGVGRTLSRGKHECDVVRITTASGATAELPVWIQPGHPDNSVTVRLGYGRRLVSERALRDRPLLGRLVNVNSDVYHFGPLANDVGEGMPQRVEGLRSPVAMTVLPGVRVEKSRGGYLVASTQDHGSMMGRPIVRSATLEEYRADPEFAKLEHKYIEGNRWEQFDSLWGEENAASADPRIGGWRYAENQWGMTIDLNACSGCNACLVACQSENNVQIVGKDQVSRGREMHWLRVDRYYIGADEDNPGMVSQVMLCQHCENAPCEQVCPVSATTHSPDGLNEMTYNRCIGTRYCANNCPYKIRRFNFYNWTKTLPVEVWMAQNPNVTVRSRGVMEKCTFCIHRIREVQQYARIEGRAVRDGEVLTACQQVCPAGAIEFGDLRNEQSRVRRSHASPRSYALLAEYANRPRNLYLARLRNPHPSLAGQTPFDNPEPVDPRNPAYS